MTRLSRFRLLAAVNGSLYNYGVKTGQIPDGFETAESIVRAVVGFGRISKATLAKWHRVGLIARPITTSLGRGKGSQSFYPRGTRDLVLEILKRRKSRSSKLIGLAWDLWWAGFRVPVETIRKRLGRFAREWEHFVKNRDIDQDLKNIETKRLPKSVARVRKRVGRKSIRAFAEAMVSVITDRVDESAIDRVSNETYLKAFNLERGSKEHTSEAGPFIQRSQIEVMHFLGSSLRGRSMVETLASISDSDLTNARDSFKWLMEVTGHAGSQTGAMLGKGAFGFDALREMGTATDWKQQAFVLMTWSSFVANSEFRQGFETYKGAEAKLDATDQDMERLRLLRADVPALSRVVTPTRIGAGLKNKRKLAHMNAEVRRIRKTHGTEIDNFVKRHPRVCKSSSESKSAPEKVAPGQDDDGRSATRERNKS